MNIVDALIKKGSTGGNNIAEAVENLPDFSSGGGTNSNAGSDGGSSTSGGSSAMIVHAAYPEDISQSTMITFDKTWQEIYDAFEAGTNVMVELTYSANTDMSNDRSGIIRVPVIGVETGYSYNSETSAYDTPDSYLVILDYGASSTALYSNQYNTGLADGYPSYDYNT